MKVNFIFEMMEKYSFDVMEQLPKSGPKPTPKRSNRKTKTSRQSSTQ